MKSAAFDDICLDTDVLGEFLKQYLSAESRSAILIRETSIIGRDAALHINRIILEHKYEDAYFPRGLVVCSTMAIVELTRKFNTILGRFGITEMQLAAFLEQPPEWFTVESLNLDILFQFSSLALGVMIGGESKAIEANDNYHVATCKARQNCGLATSDRRLRSAYYDIIV